MKNKIEISINTLLIMLMPLMMYVTISGTKVNFSIADIILVLIGFLFLINIKEFFVNKRWIYILYFVALLISLLLSQFIGKLNDNFLHVSNSVMIMEMIKTVVVGMYFFSAYIFIRTEKAYRISLITISLSSIPVLVIGILSYVYFLLGKDFFIKAFEIKTLRFLGTFEDPNLCAFYFIIIFFVSLLNFKVIKNMFLKYLMFGISMFSLIIIILTMSRGGWLALAGAIVAFVILNIRNFKKESILLVIPVIILLIILLNVDYSIQSGKITNIMVNRVQDSLSKDNDEIDRVQLTKAAIKMGNDNFLFGVGKGSFPLNSNKYLGEDSPIYKSQYIPHNTILGFYAQQGIVGALILIILPSFILYFMIKSKKKQNVYLIPLFIGLFLHSCSINVENVRFLWYILGVMLVGEKLNINLDIVPSAKINNRKFFIILSVLVLLAVGFYMNLSREFATNIYIGNGNLYDRTVAVKEPGDYVLTFDIQTDNNLHCVEVYDGDSLLKKINFKSAYGVVNTKLHIEDKFEIIFKSNKDGWMRVNNAYLIKDNKKIYLYDYVLLPRVVEDWLNERGRLVYLVEPSFRKELNIEDNKFNAFEILDTKVVRYSNLSNVFEFDYKSKEIVDKIYQLDMLIDYYTISSLLPDEYQRNIWPHRFTLYPYTSKWEENNEYKVKTNRLFSSEDFNLYGRYYDYKNKEYTQESYFPIPYKLIKENQDIIKLGESKWINIRYGKDKEENINITNNGWVESGRMNLKHGDYYITFKAQGSFYEEYSKIRLRDSSLNEIGEITLDDKMKEYMVKYHVDEYKQGVSFILELINYKSEKDVGNRKVVLQDWLKVK